MADRWSNDILPDIRKIEESYQDEDGKSSVEQFSEDFAATAQADLIDIRKGWQGVSKILDEYRTKKLVVTLEAMHNSENVSPLRVKVVELHNFRSEENARKFFKKSIRRQAD